MFGFGDGSHRVGDGGFLDLDGPVQDPRGQGYGDRAGLDRAGRGVREGGLLRRFDRFASLDGAQQGGGVAGLRAEAPGS